MTFLEHFQKYFQKVIMSVIYENSLNIDDFLDVIEEIHIIAKESKDYNEWMNRTNIYVQNWENNYQTSHII